MAKKKVREAIPSDIAARVLFLSDRTCCVCRTRGKPIQIHHIDDNPSNNAQNNLAVLCFDCHRETQIRGGFDRKLDQDQVILYRDDWNNIVALQRATYSATVEDTNTSYQLEWITSTAEIYRVNEEYALLSHFYDAIKNYELRDKYIELAIQKDSSDSNVIDLRALQGKSELIPDEIINRELSRYTKNKDWSQRARFFYKLGKYQEAAADYIRAVNKDLETGNVFAAAYYLKELVKQNLIQELFLLALAKAKEENNLWWQVRALQELDWNDELKDLLLKNADDIEQSGSLSLRELLASARGDIQKALEFHKEMTRTMRVVKVGKPKPPEAKTSRKKVKSKKIQK